MADDHLEAFLNLHRSLADVFGRDLHSAHVDRSPLNDGDGDDERHRRHAKMECCRMLNASLTHTRTNLSAMLADFGAQCFARRLMSDPISMCCTSIQLNCDYCADATARAADAEKKTNTRQAYGDRNREREKCHVDTISVLAVDVSHRA